MLKIGNEFSGCSAGIAFAACLLKLTAAKESTHLALRFLHILLKFEEKKGSAQKLRDSLVALNAVECLIPIARFPFEATDEGAPPPSLPLSILDPYTIYTQNDLLLLFVFVPVPGLLLGLL